MKKKIVVYESDAMLKLVDIKKEYIVNKSVENVKALNGISLSFRKNEFVSILGPSGCGKTTLLNIIGGLDKYTSGDLIINGKSTKKYNDKDWDVYRNHRIGFIFQSYNLIPHQNILSNVELALTIAGMSKNERIEKAKKALDKVGLKDMYHKLPNQLSGGQCQRVAIARALVNEPDILLADEPTGALDTTTSKQIMDLITEISKEKLVIMVTHNPDIAEKYSTRIIRLLDGKIESDSNAYQETYTNEKEVDGVQEKAKMSLWTAFKLSLKNLLSKFKRTILVCIAGSIGIVGVSTVLAVSSGIKDYIKYMQDDMLSGNPIAISTEGFDLGAMMNSASNEEKVKLVIENGFVNVNSMIEFIYTQNSKISGFQIKNDITKQYVDYVKAMPKEDYAAMKFDYGIDLSYGLYTNWRYDNKNPSDSKEMSIYAITQMYSSVLKNSSEEEYKKFADSISQMTTSFAQAPNNNDYILEQYDLLEGKMCENENEIVIVVNKDRALTDVLLGQLGYYSQEEFINIANRIVKNDSYASSLDKNKFTYSELLNKTFSFYPNDSIFKDNSPNILVPYTYNPYVTSSFKDEIELKITGILQPKEETQYGCLTTGIYYTEALTNKILDVNKESNIVKHYTNLGKAEVESSILTDKDGNKTYLGITYDYDYYTTNKEPKSEKGIVGKSDPMLMFLSMIPGMPTLGNASVTKSILQLSAIGGRTLPSNIYIYPVNFNSKDRVTTYLDKWNQDTDIIVNGSTITRADRTNVTYSDNLEIIINLINNMINIITYALIAFTALSLLVSTVMIGIITYVSVVERIKEIGVIRSLGGRKKDVSHLFNAETAIIGLSSGIIGIAITLLISLIINLILGIKVGIYTIASLRVTDALIMIGVSILLTMISGLIPARAAARKNPVEALRTE